MAGGVASVVMTIVLYEGFVQAYERTERHEVYMVAKQRSKELGLSLIVIGCPKLIAPWHGHGDVTVDIKHGVWCYCPNPMTEDVQRLDRHFSPQSTVVFSSHVLEHLTPEEGAKAMRVIERISVESYHIWPSRYSILANLVPSHKSWPSYNGRTIQFEAK